MANQTWNKIAIIGVGLIGGSIGLAVRKRNLANEVMGIGRDAARLAEATRLGAISTATTHTEHGVAGAELVIVCTPVERIIDHVRQVAAIADPGALITDAGSTKAEIVRELGSGVPFIGSHPLAGNEKGGVQHASADLFEGRTVIVTPTQESSADELRRLKNFWLSLGAKVVEMSAENHDQVVAITSHLPHLLASAIASATPAEYVTLTAGGWQDATRIAAGDPALWRQIMMANQENLLAALNQFDKRLAAFRQAIEAGDPASLERLLTEAKRIRDAVAS
jgi:prephenate dehydrogenase